MKKTILSIICLLAAAGAVAGEKWPDGTPVSKWFSDTIPVNPDTPGKRYVVTDYGVVKGDSTPIQTEAIRKL